MLTILTAYYEAKKSGRKLRVGIKNFTPKFEASVVKLSKSVKMRVWMKKKLGSSVVRVKNVRRGLRNVCTLRVEFEDGEIRNMTPQKTFGGRGIKNTDIWIWDGDEKMCNMHNLGQASERYAMFSIDDLFPLPFRPYQDNFCVGLSDPALMSILPLILAWLPYKDMANAQLVGRRFQFAIRNESAQKLSLAVKGVRVPEQLKHLISSPKVCEYIVRSSRRTEIFQEFCNYKCHREFPNWSDGFLLRLHVDVISQLESIPISLVDIDDISDCFEMRSMTSFDPWTKKMTVSCITNCYRTMQRGYHTCGLQHTDHLPECYDKVKPETFEGNIHECAAWMTKTYESWLGEIGYQHQQEFDSICKNAAILLSPQLLGLEVEMIDGKIRDKANHHPEGLCDDEECVNCGDGQEPEMEIEEVYNSFVAHPHRNSMIMIPRLMLLNTDLEFIEILTNHNYLNQLSE